MSGRFPAGPPLAGGAPRLVIDRRAFLALASAIAAAPDARAAASAFPDSPTILVAGPPGGRVDRWAALLAEPLGKNLLQGAPVGRENVGGPDGVTGANQFQARTAPDGATAMLMPGETALAWLVGDPRVRFDAGRWAPLWGAEASAVAACRTPLVSGRPVRVAVQSIVGPELAALLALELVGVPAVPIQIEPTGASPLDRPDIDLVLLRGRSLKAHAADLSARGWQLPFGLGMVGADGLIARDPAFADVPTALELAEHRAVAGPRDLAMSLRSVMAAAALDIALVLPLLSPAAMTAWWRQGCVALAAAPDVLQAAARDAARPIESGPMAASVATITADPPVALELRRWLADRHQWRPG